MDVLEFLLPKIEDLVVDLVPDLIIDLTGDAYAARLSERFDSGCNVYGISVDIALSVESCDVSAV